jgi:leucyl aminopeptidase (aminopeptidase T)
MGVKQIEMIKGAKKLVDDCTKVKGGELVLVITDTGMPFSIAECIAMVARERGAEVMITLMSPRPVEGNDPPLPIVQAMQCTNVIFMACSRSIFHSPSRIQAGKNGARGISITEFTEDDMLRGAIEADFLETKDLIDKVAEKLRGAKEAKITSPAGTDLYLDLKGRGEGVVALNNLCHEPGQFGVLILESSTSPNVGTAQGVIVCDASITLLKPGLVNEPVRATVKDGMVTEITGGAEAQKLRDFLAATKDPMVYNVAELGIGLNPKAKMTGVQTQDEGVFGTCHIGIGSNITWGGKIKAATHFDFIMYSPKIELDGKVLLENYHFNV